MWGCRWAGWNESRVMRPVGDAGLILDLSQACDLEEVMMDALVNDKPDFVRLFVDNGVNLGEFLTYGRLQKLYWSVSEKSLLHNLLLKKYEEKQLLLGAARSSYPPGHHPPEQGDRKPRFTLFEVAKVLKDFLHDSCKGFYQKVPTVSNALCRRRFWGEGRGLRVHCAE